MDQVHENSGMPFFYCIFSQLECGVSLYDFLASRPYCDELRALCFHASQLWAERIFVPELYMDMVMVG